MKFLKELAWKVPSTKDQRDSLTIAMTDAGYTFGFDKKELKKTWSARND